MAAQEQANDSRPEANPPVLRSWPGYEGIHDVTSRLWRSATIALLVSPVGLVFISVSRLLIISNYNPVTASAVASSSGYVDTLLGTVIPLIPLLLPYLALLLLFFGRVALGLLALVAVAFVSPMTVSGPAALGLIK